MSKFAHIADVHLGGWKQQELQDLNMESFRKAIGVCIKEKLDFVLIAGDLFDTPYPSIDILKETFAIFKKLKEARISCFIIAGSHDYSVSGKTFLDVLEKAGFCKNICNSDERDDKIILNPTIFEGNAIYGYPGRKSGLEVNDLRKIKFNDAPGMFKIFMLHTTIDKAVGSLPIDSIEVDRLPKADYYALGHLHIDFQYDKFVYPGPVFPNNFSELQDLQYGSFYIVDTESPSPLRKIQLKLKEVEYIELQVKDALEATSQILKEISKKNIQDKIVLLRVRGVLENGKGSDIKFNEIQDYVKRQKAYFMLKNTHDLKSKETEIEADITDTENVEEEAIKVYSEQNPSDFNDLIPPLMNALSIDKQEGETTDNFTKRVLDSSKKLLKF